MNKLNKLKIFTTAIVLMLFLFGAKQLHSQMKFGVGTFSCNIDGDTLSFGLNSDLNDLYYMFNGGTADFGLIKIQWDGVKTASDIKVQTLTLEKGFVEDRDKKINIIWADFYSNMPYIIKSGKLSVLSNDGSTITGTLEISAEVGGSSVISEFLKGKKETNLRNGYFEIKF
jgi:hypothetical protein